MGKRIYLRRGDIYRFHLDETRFGLGQVIEPGAVFYTTILRDPVPHGFDLGEVDTSGILLCGWTMDALLFHGRWHVVGNLPVPDRQVPRPNSKVQVEGEKWVSDFRGRPLRRATKSEWDSLDPHSSYSPIVYEDAFKAHHGLMPAEPHHGRIAIDHLRAQAAIGRGSLWRRLSFRAG